MQGYILATCTILSCRPSTLTCKIAVAWKVARIVCFVAGYRCTKNTDTHHHHEADFAPKLHPQVPEEQGYEQGVNQISQSIERFEMVRILTFQRFARLRGL